MCTVCCHLHLQAEEHKQKDAANTERLLQGIKHVTSDLAAYLTPTHEDRWHRFLPEYYEAYGGSPPRCFLVTELAGAVGTAIEEQLQPIKGRLDDLYNISRC
jgi:hypothetical protein